MAACFCMSAIVDTPKGICRRKRREWSGTDITRRIGRTCLVERVSYFIVEVPGGRNVAHDFACSRRAWQLVPARASLRAADPARGIGWGRQFGNQRCAVRSRQSKGPVRPERYRKCLSCAAAPHQHACTRGPLVTVGTDARRRADLLSGRVTADHQPARYRAEAQGTAAPARPPAGLQLHGDLPGMLDRL